MSILLSLIILVVIVVVAVIIIDKTFTGEASTFNWLAKLVVGVLALIVLVNMLQGAGVLHF